MRHKILLLSVICILGFVPTRLWAQDSMNTTGGNALGSGGSASYSIGQIFYQTQTGTNGSVIQGVQQPYEISVITAIEESEGIDLWVSAYPNPTTDNLILEIKKFELPVSTLSFQLFDVQGKLIQSERIMDYITTISMGNLASGIYIVKVMQGSKEIKTFKIIKN